MRVLTARYKDITHVAYSWDGGTLYALSRPRLRSQLYTGGVERWDGCDGSPVDVDCGPLTVDRMIVLPTSELLVSGTTRTAGFLRSVGPLVAPYQQDAGIEFPFVARGGSSFAISPQGDQMIIAVVRWSFIYDRGFMGGFRLPLNRPVRPNWDEQTEGTIGIDFEPSGKRLGVFKRSSKFGPRGGRMKPLYSLQWHDAATGKAVGESIPLPWVGDTVSPTGPPIGETALLAVGGTRLVTMRGADLLAIDLTDPAAPPAVVKNPDGKHFTGLAVHPDGTRVLATGNDATVREYDATTLQELRAYAWKVGRLRCVAIAPDGLTAAAGSDTGKVVVWDLE